MREVDDLMYVEEVYPKDLGYVVSQLVEAVNELMEQVDELKRAQLVPSDPSER